MVRDAIRANVGQHLTIVSPPDGLSSAHEHFARINAVLAILVFARAFCRRRLPLWCNGELRRLNASNKSSSIFSASVAASQGQRLQSGMPGGTESTKSPKR
jgi:hypothetical protein